MKAASVTWMTKTTNRLNWILERPSASQWPERLMIMIMMMMMMMMMIVDDDDDDDDDGDDDC